MELEEDSLACEYDQDGNILDAITYSPIPPDSLIRVKSGTSIYCFDLNTLYESMVKLHLEHPIDPFTLLPFPDDITQAVLEYGKRQMLNVTYIRDDKPTVIQVNRFDTVGDLFLYIIMETGDLNRLYIFNTPSGTESPSTIVDLNLTLERYNSNKNVLLFMPPHELDKKLYEFLLLLLAYTDSKIGVNGDKYDIVGEMIIKFIKPNLYESPNHEPIARRIIPFDISNAAIDEMELDSLYPPSQNHLIDQPRSPRGPISSIPINFNLDVGELFPNNQDENTVLLYQLFGMKAPATHISVWQAFDDRAIINAIMDEKMTNTENLLELYRYLVTLSPNDADFKSEAVYLLVMLLKRILEFMSTKFENADYRNMMLMKYSLQNPVTYRAINSLLQAEFQNDMLDPDNTLELSYTEFDKLEYPIHLTHISKWKEGTLNRSADTLNTINGILRTINAKEREELLTILSTRKDFQILQRNGYINFVNT